MSWIYSIGEGYRWVLAKVGHTWKRSVTFIKEFQTSTARRSAGKFGHAAHMVLSTRGKFRSWIDHGRCRERREVRDRRNMCAKSRQALTQPEIISLERHNVAPSYPFLFYDVHVRPPRRDCYISWYNNLALTCKAIIFRGYVSSIKDRPCLTLWILTLARRNDGGKIEIR